MKGRVLRLPLVVPVVMQELEELVAPGAEVRGGACASGSSAAPTQTWQGSSVHNELDP